MAVVTMRQLLEAGVHFGHQTRRWNPKMKRFIHSDRNGIYILDLRQTVDRIARAYSFTRDLVSKGGTVLFIGTKRQAQESIEYHANRVGMPYVTERWLGGMLTNFETIKSRIGRLRELEAMEDEGLFEILPKKEVLELEREHEKLQTNLGGIRHMAKLPDAVWIVDTVREEIATREANRLNIPVIAPVDTNCDPDLVQYPVPGNDDAIRSVALLTRIVADACADGLLLRASRSPDEELREQAMAAAAGAGSSLGVAEPKAQWEIELEREQAAAQAAAAGISPEQVTGGGDEEATEAETADTAAMEDAEAADVEATGGAPTSEDTPAPAAEGTDTDADTDEDGDETS
ncbi:MAG: 30S ribosomal protein S2 [Actinobacteria bacterium]|nr:30S ribosomal protein S2 [Actinomycetota bacterium]